MDWDVAQLGYDIEERRSWLADTPTALCGCTMGTLLTSFFVEVVLVLVQ